MRRRDRLTLGFGALALAISVLAIGGALRWVQAIVSIVVAITLGTLLFSRRRLDRVSPLLLLLGIAIALTAVQLIPLPWGILSALGGDGMDLRANGASVAGVHPWPCLSLDPAGTLHGLAFLVTLFGVALVSLRFAASERGRFMLLGGVAIACGLAAFVTGMHTLVNADDLYGLYEPLHATPPVLGPLLNPNHLGCLMALGATLCVGLVFYERQTPQLRVLWIVIAIGCTLVTFATLSRGATLSLVLGVLVAGTIAIGRFLKTPGELQPTRWTTLRNQLPIALVIGLGIGLAVYTSAGNVADQLEDTSLSEVNVPVSKFAAWKSSIDLLADSPWVGVGRGALEPTFTRVHEPSAYVTFSHLENEYIQAVVEWGIPGGLALALALGACMIAGIRRWKDGPLAAAALGGLAGVMFQSSVDFGVELLGIAVPVTIVASTVLIVPFRETSSVRWKIWHGFVIAALLGAALVLFLPLTSTLQEDHDDLVALTPPPMPQVLDVIRRHPLDYFGYGEAADQLMHIGDERSVSYLNQALGLHPSHPGLHRLAARMLVDTGRLTQAAMEYSAAVHGTPMPHQLLTEIVTKLPKAADAANAIPPDYFNYELVLRSLTQLKREDVSELFLLRVVDQPTDDMAIVDQLYELAMTRGDLDIALHTANFRLKMQNTTTSKVMLAKVQFRLRQFEVVRKGLADVEKWKGRIDEQAQGWILVCDAYFEERNWNDALECIHHLDASGIEASNHEEITKREASIAEYRAAEAKAHAIQELERSLKLPVDVDIPVVMTNRSPIPSSAAVGIPSGGIANPLLRKPK